MAHQEESSMATLISTHYCLDDQILEEQQQVPCQINELKAFYEQELRKKDELIRKLSNKLNSNTSNKLSNQEKEIQNHKEGLQSIASVLACKDSYEVCFEEIKELIRKKTALEGQVSRLQDTVASSEFEQRAARETTLRLSGELNREVNARDNAQTEVKEMQKELEATKALLEGSEANVRLLRDRIQTLTEALEKAHSDFGKREEELRRIGTLDGSVRVPVHPGSPNNLPINPQLSKRYEEEYNHFQEFLRFGQYYLKKDADAPSSIILKEIKSRIVSLEAELGKTRLAFMKCQGDTGEAESAINSRDSRILQLEETVERLRSELAEVSLVNEALKKDKCSLNSFLMKVADHLKLGELATEAQIPLLMDAIFTRLRQIVAGEGERAAGQRVKIVRLQQKLRELTDRNESLELQVNVLRRRINDQEEPRATSPRRPATSLTDADRQRRRMSKQVEQMRAEILALQAENLQLKAQSLNESKASLAAIGKAKVLHAAETRARELQNRCERQAEELESLRRRLEFAEASASQEQHARDEQSSSLSAQLTECRTALDAARKAEKQLVEFRSAVARTVGLDCEQLAIPDVEILCHLEQIMSAES
ncbi:hypothetical protein AAHC03_01738 [Spirometra sp. Aus1]